MFRYFHNRAVGYKIFQRLPGKRYIGILIFLKVLVFHVHFALPAPNSSGCHLLPPEKRRIFISDTEDFIGKFLRHNTGTVKKPAIMQNDRCPHSAAASQNPRKIKSERKSPGHSFHQPLIIHLILLQTRRIRAEAYVKDLRLQHNIQNVRAENRYRQ